MFNSHLPSLPQQSSSQPSSGALFSLSGSHFESRDYLLTQVSLLTNTHTHTHRNTLFCTCDHNVTKILSCSHNTVHSGYKFKQQGKERNTVSTNRDWHIHLQPVKSATTTREMEPKLLKGVQFVQGFAQKGKAKRFTSVRLCKT